MLQRQSEVTVYTCPCCGATLLNERGALRCREHGSFFAYGPSLVVKAPRRTEDLPAALLPWETYKGRVRR